MGIVEVACCKVRTNRSDGDKHVGLQSDKFGGERANGFGLALQGPPLIADIPPLLIAKSAHAFDEGVERPRHVGI